MQQGWLDGITVFMSTEVVEDYEDRAAEVGDGATMQDAMAVGIFGLFHDRLEQEVMAFLTDYQAAHGGMAILDAHGHRDPESNEWLFEDDEHERTVQSWVDEMDGRFGVLVLLVCDDGAIGTRPPTTKFSILVVGDGLVRSGIGLEDYHNFQLLHPSYGEISDYTVADARAKLLVNAMG